MPGLGKMIDVHSHPILPFGQGAPVGPGQQQPEWSVETALSYMEQHDISACVLSDPDSAKHATGQKARDIAYAEIDIWAGHRRHRALRSFQQSELAKPVVRQCGSFVPGAQGTYQSRNGPDKPGSLRHSLMVAI
jgi:hypothetical protein